MVTTQAYEEEEEEDDYFNEDDEHIESAYDTIDHVETALEETKIQQEELKVCANINYCPET